VPKVNFKVKLHTFDPLTLKIVILALNFHKLAILTYNFGPFCKKMAPIDFDKVNVHLASDSHVASTCLSFTMFGYSLLEGLCFYRRLKIDFWVGLPLYWAGL
jgi:hypothetical protein